MEEKWYLLSLEGFWEGEIGQRRLAEALEKVDEERRKKAARMRAQASREACVGAGLLLQLAVQEALAEGTGGKREPGRPGEDGLLEYDLSQALALLKNPIPLRIKYGETGKPYLRDYPFFFNLSHSGSYVSCGIARQEIGVDIQRMEGMSPERLERIAGRFFCREEQEALAACPGEERARDLFYCLWTRKEAYGKLTGKGILAAAGENLLGEGPKGLRWRCLRRQEGYRMAFCARETAGKLPDGARREER